MTPVGAATNSLTAARKRKAGKERAAAMEVRSSVDRMMVTSRMGWCACHRSAAELHRKEAGADTQGRSAARIPICTSLRPCARKKMLMKGQMHTSPPK
jgi:hypothetical protein